MLSGMSANELTFWRHVYATEFLGADREYLVGAKLEALYINSKLSNEDEPVSPLDRIPFLPKDEPQEDGDPNLGFLFAAVNSQFEEEERQRIENETAEVEARMNAFAASLQKAG